MNLIDAELLYTFLDALPAGAVLPRAAEIATKIGVTRPSGAYLISEAFDSLQTKRRIVTAHGTRSTARGHRIVRMPDGRTFATEGCPLALQRMPGAPAMRPVTGT